MTITTLDPNTVARGRTERSHSRAGLPPDWAELVPELNAQPDDLLITKITWGAFTATGLEARLKALGVTQLVIAGVATSIGVESTARQAYELGFNVTLALDAMTDLSLEAHENSVAGYFRDRAKPVPPKKSSASSGREKNNPARAADDGGEQKRRAGKVQSRMAACAKLEQPAHGDGGGHRH